MYDEIMAAAIKQVSAGQSIIIKQLSDGSVMIASGPVQLTNIQPIPASQSTNVSNRATKGKRTVQKFPRGTLGPLIKVWLRANPGDHTAAEVADGIEHQRHSTSSTLALLSKVKNGVVKKSGRGLYTYRNR